MWFVSGGEAVESAVKLARQYFIERDGMHTSKALVIARWNLIMEYHRDHGFRGSIPRRRIYSPLLRISQNRSTLLLPLSFDKNTPGAALSALTLGSH